MRFLNPKTDFAFKRIFGSTGSKDILISFINAMLRFGPGREIVDLTIIDPYQAPKILGMKDTYLDVKARSKDKREFIIEMQVLNVAGFEKRVLYNAAKAYSIQIESAEDYLKLNPVIAITITDFIMFEGTSRIITNFCLMDKAEFFAYSNSDLELVFIELPKFDKAEEQLADITDKWIYFLKNAESLKFIPQTLAVEQPISQAFQIANRAGLTREELDDQERREFFIQDQRGAITKATEQGLERGLKRGLEQGLEQGRQEGLQKGIQKGIQEGLQKGMQQGRQEGIHEGIQKGLAQNLYDLYLEGVITSEQAKAQLEKLYTSKSLSEEIYQKLISEIQNNPRP